MACGNDNSLINSTSDITSPLTSLVNTLHINVLMFTCTALLFCPPGKAHVIHSFLSVLILVQPNCSKIKATRLSSIILSFNV